jgi:hypothetical protein
MPINIKNREAEALLNALAKKARLGKSQLVLELLRGEAARQARMDDIPDRKKRITSLARRSARRIGARAPTPDEILGYGPDGLPR